MTARNKLPVAIFSVPVTIKLMVEGRGLDEHERTEDAKDQASKWARTALLEVGEPVRL